MRRIARSRARPPLQGGQRSPDRHPRRRPDRDRRRRRQHRPCRRTRAAQGRPATPPAPTPVPPATAAAARSRPSPTPTSCSATWTRATSSAAGCARPTRRRDGLGPPRRRARPLGAGNRLGHPPGRQREHGRRRPHPRHRKEQGPAPLQPLRLRRRGTGPRRWRSPACSTSRGHLPARRRRRLRPRLPCRAARRSARRGRYVGRLDSARLGARRARSTPGWSAKRDSALAAGECAGRRVVIERSVDLRLAGQYHEITVDLFVRPGLGGAGSGPTRLSPGPSMTPTPSATGAC